MNHLRHNRHALLAGVGETGIGHQTSTALTLIGCGGLGQSAAAALGSAGVGLLRLVDGDSMQPTNLARLPLMTETDIGNSKASLLAAAITRNNPIQKCEVVTDIAGASNLPHLLQDTDIVIDATDNWPIRKQLAEICRARGIPLISGGALGTDGWVGVCLPSSPHLESWLRQPEQMADTCERVGVFSPLVGMIGNMMAMEALKLIWQKTGNPSWSCLTGKVFCFDARRGESITIDLPAFNN